MYCTPPVISLWLLCLWMQGIFFDRFQRFSVDGFSAVSCDFDVSIRRGKLMSFYSTILSQWYVSAHCYNLYYCLKSALITSLENSMDYIVHGLAKSWTQLSDFPFHHLLSSTRKLGLYTSTGCCDMLPRSLFSEGFVTLTSGNAISSFRDGLFCKEVCPFP